MLATQGLSSNRDATEEGIATSMCMLILCPSGEQHTRSATFLSYAYAITYSGLPKPREERKQTLGCFSPMEPKNPATFYPHSEAPKREVLGKNSSKWAISPGIKENVKIQVLLSHLLHPNLKSSHVPATTELNRGDTEVFHHGVEFTDKSWGLRHVLMVCKAQGSVRNTKR